MVECVGDPVRASICHCLACQQRTGSAFGIQARFASDRLTFSGNAQTWERVGDSGGRATFRFCPTCGSTVYWTIDKVPGFTMIAVGAFADPTFVAPSVSVYSERRHAWTTMPDLHVEELS